VEGPVSDRLRLMLGSRALRPLFEVRTTRRPFTIGDPEPLAEITLDDAQYFACSGGHVLRGEPLRRVEVEQVADGGLERAATFLAVMRDSCRLTPSRASKFQTGLALAGYVPEHAVDFGGIRLDAEGSAADFALAMARRYFADFVTREPGTRLGEDAEELHQMRVGARRLRTTLGDYGAVLPAHFGALRDELGWAAAPLGRSRDLDVQRNALAERQTAAPAELTSAFVPLLALMDAERATARQELLAHLDSERYRDFVRAMALALRTPDAPEDPTTSAREAAARVVRRRFRQFRREALLLTRHAPATQHHDVRRRARRLRYSLDCALPLIGNTAVQLLSAVRGVQDLLGELQDRDVMIAWLRDQQGREAAPLPWATQQLIERLTTADAGRMRALRKQWPKAFARARRRWRPVRQAFLGLQGQ
jgi:CHAD domain-containing protein